MELEPTPEKAGIFFVEPVLYVIKLLVIFKDLLQSSLMFLPTQKPEPVLETCSRQREIRFCASRFIPGQSRLHCRCPFEVYTHLLLI